MKKLEKISVVAVIAASVMFLAGCAPSSASNKTAPEGGGSMTGTITVWDSYDGPMLQTRKQYASDFEKANPDVKVNYVTMSGPDIKQKVQAGIVSGDLPDIVQYWGAVLLNRL